MNAAADLPASVTGAGAVGAALAHESAHLHVTGSAAYIDDLPELAGTLHCALGLSPQAHGRLRSVRLDVLRALPGVEAVFTAADIPGINDCGPIIRDDPILAPADAADGSATGLVQYLGQPVLAVVATTRDLARRAAARAKDVLDIDPLPPVLNARDAHARQQYVVPPMHLTRESSPGANRRAIDAAPHRLQGRFSLGGQEQFYLEGQISYAVPTEDGALHVHCSTQHPSEMQHVIAHALQLPAHKVLVECRRMGGGFGGKESQSGLFAAVAALAAQRLRRPVKLRLDRDDDFLITGRRHGFEFDYEVGFDAAGRVLGVEVTMITNAGFSADLSPPVMTRAICHFDNAYWLPEVAIHGYLAKTNTQSNTAFRGFGGPQGALAIEVILDEIARQRQIDPLAVRRANYYGTLANNITPYRQTVTDNVIGVLTDELVRSSDYAARRQAVSAFNARSEVLKKGLALTPVKFGISFNVTHFNQAGALVHVYTDGSVLVNHGGTEMGQGLNTKVAQVVAHELGLPPGRVRSTATDTSKVANTSATAASTGSDLNGKAAQDAARKVRVRLAQLFASQVGCDAADVVFGAGRVRGGRHEMAFEALVAKAYIARVQLWSDGFYSTPGLHWDKATLSGRPFYYFAYGAAVSEVVVDTLTGEWKLLRADLLHDVGRSLNPAIDIGQIEGAFVQGTGWLTCEDLVWHPTTGALLTHAPSTYKIPTANDVPADFRTALFDNSNVEDSIHRSKAVGEPPLLLGFSAFLAIRDAISAAGGHREHPPLSAPATPEAILRALNAVV
jgi:xanthine dehydrogenase large subunit